MKDTRLNVKGLDRKLYAQAQDAALHFKPKKIDACKWIDLAIKEKLERDKKNGT